MTNGLKSVAVAVILLFVFIVLLGGEFEDREVFGIPIGGRRAINFCESLGDAPILGLLPCFLINWVVIIGTLMALVLVVGLARKLLQ